MSKLAATKCTAINVFCNVTMSHQDQVPAPDLFPLASASCFFVFFKYVVDNMAEEKHFTRGVEGEEKRGRSGEEGEERREEVRREEWRREEW